MLTNIRRILRSVLFLFIGTLVSYGQSERIDSLAIMLEKHEDDTAKVNLLNKLAYKIYPSAPQVAENYAKEAALLSQKLKYKKGLSRAYKTLGITYGVTNNYPVSLDYLFRSLKIDVALDDRLNMAKCLHNISLVYFYTKQRDKGYEALNKAIYMDYELGNMEQVAHNQLSLVMYYIEDKRFTEALGYCTKVIATFDSLNEIRGKAIAYSCLAKIYIQTKRYNDAITVYRKAHGLLLQDKNRINITYNYISIARIYLTLKKYDSCYVYCNQALELSRTLNSKSQASDALEVLSNLYEMQGKFEKSLTTFKEATKLRDETFNLERSKQISELSTIYEIENKEKQLELNQATINKQNIIILSISVVMLLLSLLIVIAWRFYNSKRRANKELRVLYSRIKEQNEEIYVQSEELKQANEEILSINQNLENILQERTIKIIRQNNQLKEYAFTNSHKVRGPVARLMGLFNLVKIHDQIPNTEYLRMMEITVNELDTIIRELNEKLQASENESNQ